MDIKQIGTFQTPKLNQFNQNQKVTSGEAQTVFKNSLKTAIDKLNHLQVESDKKTEALANGKVDDLHDVMITAQKSSIALQTAVEIQSKAINAYNEIMRMQV